VITSGFILSFWESGRTRINFGLGIKIKEFQKEILLTVFRVNLVVCTYDPLTAVNAYRNIRQFGMKVLEYRLAPYGEYGGRLNRQDVPSDRFFTAWDLLLEHQPLVPEEKIEHLLSQRPKALESEWKTIKTARSELELQLVRRVRLDLSEEQILVEVPVDFYQLLRATADGPDEIRNIPVDWRLKSRDVFLHYFQQGYKVVDFFKASSGQPAVYYLLEKR